MLMQPVLVADDVRVLMQAAREEAGRLGVRVSIAVVDAAGVLLALERLDGARLHTPEAAWLKARSAAIVQSSTADLQHEVMADPALLSFPGRMPLAGGLPVLHEDHVVGGVASSGAQPD
nr:heme-binding protein [uncultured Lichenicoccus sp.]